MGTILDTGLLWCSEDREDVLWVTPAVVGAVLRATGVY